VIATGNPGKLREIREILAGYPVALRSLADFEPIAFPDEGAEYEENAIVKARTVASQTGMIAVADDSGLEVDALGGDPGPLSARYGGPGLDDAGRVRTLLEALSHVPEAERGARFVCIAALVTPEGDVQSARGECHGHILREPRGREGFGYDPIFRAEDGEATMAELPADDKNRISHRARAFRALWDMGSSRAARPAKCAR
jgi:XTP/dITP diphosphohydrolase